MEEELKPNNDSKDLENSTIEVYNDINSSAHKVNSKHKDRLFCKLFGNPENKADLLSLYNALNGTSYSDVQDLEIYTIEDVIYMGMKNDAACLIDGRLSLLEHQSTFNPNMPLRGLNYFVHMYERYAKSQRLNLYSKSLQKIPTPQYFVFYNGEEEREDRSVLRLSDAFMHPSEQNAYEWTAIMLNINIGHNAELLNACKTLKDYSTFIATIRHNKTNNFTTCEAIDMAVDWCIKNNVLSDFLLKHKAITRVSKV